jgi:glutamine amidotransferase PdxT
MNEFESVLCPMHGRHVTIVRPLYGTQSESFEGRLTVHAESYPIQFQVSMTEHAIIFTLDDVADVDSSHRINVVTISLKGPMDYLPLPINYSTSDL